MVVVILGLALLGFGIAGSVYARSRRAAREGEATARLCLEASRQRDRLIAAIQGYKQSLGSYPPDHVLCQTPLSVDAVTNQLLYELLGTVHDVTNNAFIPSGFPQIPASMVREFFGTESIRNSVEKPQQLRHFLNATNTMAVYPVQRRGPVGLLAIWPNWEGMEAELYSYFEMASWRYNSSSPEHNAGGFDLWLEIRTPRTNILVKNW
jgi:hypothetical protein